MDYWDRFFEAPPRPMAVASIEPQLDPAAAYRASEPAPVVAMEPIPNPTPSQGREREVQSGSLRAAEPRPGPAAPPVAAGGAEDRTRLLVRQNQWLTQFWMELSPAQQARVRRQLRRGEVVLASGQADPAAAWDSMGLSDRAKLIFGADPPAERPAPPDRRGEEVLARDS